MLKSFASALLATLVLLPTAHADVAVIVHPSNNSALDDLAISRLFLGEVKSFPGGAAAAPVDQKNNDICAEFHNQILNKTTKEVRKIWARQVFTGGLKPPPALDGDDAVLQYVATTPDAIGYVQASRVNNKVKVIRKAP